MTMCCLKTAMVLLHAEEHAYQNLVFIKVQ